MSNVVPFGVLGCRGPELIILGMRNTKLMLRRRVLRWIVIAVGWCWVGMVAWLQWRWVAKVCCQVWLSRWVVNVGCGA